MQVHQYPGPEVLVAGDFTFRQHPGPHTDAPNWPCFLTFASQYLNKLSKKPGAI